MMDTVLNLGLNKDTIKGLIEKTGNPRFAWDSYRRFVQMYGDVVLDMKPEKKEDEDPFEVIIEKKKHELGIKLDTELTSEDLIEIVSLFKSMIKEKKGVDFPEEPMEQLWGAINAVFGSWMNPRAIKYRELNGIPSDWGTAVNVQAMVFGNMGDDCATGVAFTRNPATGERLFYGEFLVNAQGEDVVAGIRTPQQITKQGSLEWAKNNGISEKERTSKYPSLEEIMQKPYEELVDIYKNLEQHYKEMQDIEFTIQNEKLWMLQTRSGKRTAAAAVRIAVEMVDENLIDIDTALLRIQPNQLNQLLLPRFDDSEKRNMKVVAKGLPASPGAATGIVVFHADDAEAQALEGKKVVLVRIETSPEDIGGMNVAQGILTQRGGMTSHAAVVARGMGKCCVAGCGSLNIDYIKKVIEVEEDGQLYTIKEGDWISIDGTTGEIMIGKCPTVEPEFSGSFGKLMSWADDRRRLGVRTNADTPKDSKIARRFGAEGIGLTRTEHMFFEGDRIWVVREMIMAEDEEGRKKALDKLLPMQREDFIGIFEAMEGLPVTIRTLDPPLHEFLPHSDDELKEMAERLGTDLESVEQRASKLKEFNPMLGHRGCRLGVTYPEITAMQVRAIIEAACELIKQGKVVKPEIMIPLIGTLAEFSNQRDIVVQVAEQVIKDYGVRVHYLVGTMIEIPRAALVADKVATQAEFFSFGTNDLTQMTYGYSRDDSGVFLKDYIEKGILKNDPFQILDREGVGQLVEMGTKRGRQTRSNLKVGICGEHGGEPSSIEFCHIVGMDYVSCSPFRVPIARLAAAQAAIRERRNK